MHIICMIAKFWSKDTFTENSKALKKECYLGILLNLKTIFIDLKIPTHTAG